MAMVWLTSRCGWFFSVKGTIFGQVNAVDRVRWRMGMMCFFFVVGRWYTVYLFFGNIGNNNIFPNDSTSPCHFFKTGLNHFCAIRPEDSTQCRTMESESFASRNSFKWCGVAWKFLDKVKCKARGDCHEGFLVILTVDRHGSWCLNWVFSAFFWWGKKAKTVLEPSTTALKQSLLLHRMPSMNSLRFFIEVWTGDGRVIGLGFVDSQPLQCTTSPKEKPRRVRTA